VAIYEPYPMGQGGGNLRTQWYIVKLLDRRRFRPVVIAPEDTPFLDRFRECGAEVIVEAPPPSIHRFAGQVLRDTLARRVRSSADVIAYNVRIARLLRRRRIDVLYCNSIRALLLAGIGGKLARVPVLWYVKGALENSLLDRIGFALADRILFFCAANRDDRYRTLVRWFRRKIGIVRIGLDPSVIANVESADGTALRGELQIDPSRVNVAIIGQVYRPKGVHFALEALRRIVGECPEIRLYVVGDHVLEEFRGYRDELDAFVAQHGLADHVRFTGWRTDALQVLALMDAQLHPSMAEGFGRAVLEGMALGKPVIASAVGGLREIIRDGENGFLVPVGDVQAMAERLRVLARDRALRARIGAAARRTVFDGYLIEDKIRQLEAIWAAMSAKAGAR
jgi:glycosyltransferase involved in cell wall biosynthesis